MDKKQYNNQNQRIWVNNWNMISQLDQVLTVNPRQVTTSFLESTHLNVTTFQYVMWWKGKYKRFKLLSNFISRLSLGKCRVIRRCAIQVRQNFLISNCCVMGHFNVRETIFKWNYRSNNCHVLFLNRFVIFDNMMNKIGKINAANNLSSSSLY